MMINSTPWDDIKTPQNELAVRLIKDIKHLKLYWGKNTNNQCIFILELEGDHVELYRKNTVVVQGINIELKHIKTADKQGLIITLEKQVDKDLFYSMCETLVSSLSDITDTAIGLSVSLMQIKRWKNFMAGKDNKVLSLEELRGLFGELLFLKDMIKNNLSESYVLDSWQGPETSHQDFIFSNTAVEIKTISGKERNTIYISSEDQLENMNVNLFLRIYRLATNPDSNNGLSINQLVKEIESNFNDVDSVEIFNNKLGKAGYIELTLYDKHKFSVVEQVTYNVTDNFPRIIRSTLPEGVFKTKYEIKLEKIKQYICKNEELWK